MGCSNYPDKVSHRIPITLVLEELSLIELVFGKVVELFAEFAIQTVRAQSTETVQPLPHNALAGNVVCLNSNSHDSEVWW